MTSQPPTSQPPTSQPPTSQPPTPQPTRERTPVVLTGLVVLLIVVLGTPEVWDDLRGGGGLGLESVFYPVLGVAFGYLAVKDRAR